MSPLAMIPAQVQGECSDWYGAWPSTSRTSVKNLSEWRAANERDSSDVLARPTRPERLIQLENNRLANMMRWPGPVCALAAAMCATAGPGYLPLVGPPPLRFEAPPPRAAEPFILSPLAFVEPRPAVPLVEPLTSITPTPSLDTNITAPPPPSPNLTTPLPGAEPTPANAIVAAPSFIEPLGPQLFMKYFTGRHGTNSTGISIYSPVGFVPPTPIAPPSSSATFQTTPPGKP